MPRWGSGLTATSEEFQVSPSQRLALASSAMNSSSQIDRWIDKNLHPIGEAAYRNGLVDTFEKNGALVLSGFFTTDFVTHVVAESAERESEAFFANSTHNVYLTDPDPALSPDHAFNRQVVSSKGLIADDQISEKSPLRVVYENREFTDFLCALLKVDRIYPYEDDLSSINVHFAPASKELGWHFDNSSFAVTTLLQAPENGGLFQYVPEVRDADAGEMAYQRVTNILDENEGVTPLKFAPGDLVLFRGRNALHRVTPTEGPVTRILAVFAYNDQSGIGLSDSALETFYGRTQ